MVSKRKCNCNWLPSDRDREREREKKSLSFAFQNNNNKKMIQNGFKVNGIHGEYYAQTRTWTKTKANEAKRLYIVQSPHRGRNSSISCWLTWPTTIIHRNSIVNYSLTVYTAHTETNRNSWRKLRKSEKPPHRIQIENISKCEKS